MATIQVPSPHPSHHGIEWRLPRPIKQNKIPTPNKRLHASRRCGACLSNAQVSNNANGGHHSDAECEPRHGPEHAVGRPSPECWPTCRFLKSPTCHVSIRIGLTTGRLLEVSTAVNAVFRMTRHAASLAQSMIPIRPAGVGCPHRDSPDCPWWRRCLPFRMVVDRRL